MPTDPVRRPTRTAGLLLRVRGPGGRCDEFYLAPGLTIGRSPANTVVVDDPAVDRAHARVEVGGDGAAMLRCVGPDAALATPGGATARTLVLEAGVRFAIGPAAFECLAGRRVPGAEAGPGPLACPHCDAPGLAIEGDHAHLCPACRGLILPVRPDPRDPAPTLLPAEYGPFVADRFVARGGMGLVLRGAGAGDRPVAIKVLPPGGGGDPARPDREAELLGRVCHPNVVGLLGHGRSGRYAYLALEWVDGPSLREVIAEAERSGRPVGFADAGRWFDQVARGLAAIHAVGLVHRDIKPSNILVGTDGVARVSDLGIARRADASATMATATGHAPGTFAYMAPEQFRAQGGVDARADLYALGVTFHELLTGSRPVGAWRPASEVRPDVPGEFTHLLGLLMGPRPEDRPRDIFEVLAIRSAAGRPGSAAPPGRQPTNKAASLVLGAEAALRGAMRVGRESRDRLAARFGLLRVRYAGAEHMANLMARNGAIRGGTWMAAIAAVVGVPAALVAAIREADPSRLIEIAASPLAGAVVGIAAGGLVGAIRGVVAGTSGRDPGTVVPLRAGGEVRRIAVPIRRWVSSALRSAPGPTVPNTANPGVESVPASAANDPGIPGTPEVPPGRGGEGGSALNPNRILAPAPQGDVSRSGGTPVQAERSPVQLRLTPLHGGSAWQLDLDGDATTLTDLGTMASLAIDPAEAEASFRFPKRWRSLDVPVIWRKSQLEIRRRGIGSYYFRPDPRAIREIRAHLDAILRRQGPGPFRYVRGRGYSQVAIGLALIFAGSGLSTWSYVDAVLERRPEPTYVVFWGLLLVGLLKVGRGVATFRRGDGILQRRRAAHRADPSGPGLGPVDGVAYPESGPWPPWAVGLGTVVLGPIWGGLVSLLNWRRLDPDARPRLPTILIAVGWFAFFVIEWSRPLTWLPMAAYAALGLSDLAAQHRRYRAYRLAGGPRGKARIPLLLSLGVVAFMPWDLADRWAASRISSDFDRAARAARLGHPDEAIPACDRALANPQLDPADRATLLALRGLARAQKEDMAGARADGDAAVGLAPDLPYAWDCRGEIRFLAGDRDGAIADCTRAIELEAASAGAFDTRAAAHLALDHLEAAIADADRAIALAPSLARPHSTRAHARLATDRFDAAATDAERLLALDPSQAGAAHLVRAIAFAGKRDWDRSISAAGELIGLNPGHFAGWFHRGSAYYEKGEADRAIADLTRALELAPALAQALNLRGLARLEKEEPDAAIADFDAALAIDPGMAIAHVNRGRAQLARKQNHAAIADFARALAIEPGNVAALLWEGRAYQGGGDHDRAIANFDEVIRRMPENSLAYNDRGLSRFDQGQYDRAAADFSEAIRFSPDVALYHANRGLAHRAKGDATAAIADFRTAIQLDPGHAGEVRRLLEEVEAADRRGR